MYADCELVVVAVEVGVEGVVTVEGVVPVDDLQSAAQLLGVSGPSHVPSPQHCRVCPAAHAVAVTPPPPVGGIPLPPPEGMATALGAAVGVLLGMVVGALVLGEETVEDSQSAAQLLDVSGPSHVPSPQHCRVCPAAHAVAVIPPPPPPEPEPPPAGVLPPPPVEVPVLEVGVTPAGGTKRGVGGHAAIGVAAGRNAAELLEHSSPCEYSSTMPCEYLNRLPVLRCEARRFRGS